VKLTIRYGLDTMPDDTKDKIIAPKISKLRSPAAPDISAERKFLLNSFILNFKLSMGSSNKNRQFTFNVIRKTEDAFEEYCSAVESLKAYIADGGPKLSHYFSAVRHFEHCVAHLYQAVRCLNALSRMWSGEKQFDHGDGSVLERIQQIHTAVKHMDGRFESASVGDVNSFSLFATKTDGTNPVAVKNASDTANLPMWLTDEGIESAEARVTYAELADEIRQWYREAENIATIDPGRKNAKV